MLERPDVQARTLGLETLARLARPNIGIVTGTLWRTHWAPSQIGQTSGAVDR